MTAFLSETSVAPTPPESVDTHRTEQNARWLCPALVTLAIGVALTALLGPLTDGTIRYRVSADALNQAADGTEPMMTRWKFAS